jgi:hypothetical protein
LQDCDKRRAEKIADLISRGGGEERQQTRRLRMVQLARKSKEQAVMAKIDLDSLIIEDLAELRELA